MDNETMLPMDWKPLREAAAAFANRMIDVAPSSLMTIQPAIFADGMHAIWMVLLADLSKPGPRDFWAWWLAEKVGMNAANGAMVCPASVPGRFALVCGTSASEWHIFDAVHEGADGCFHGGTRVPELAGLTDGAALLRAVLLAVEPA